MLIDKEIDVKWKLSALWSSVMFCYVYGDYFGLYKPGALENMIAGQMGPLGPTTQGVLVGTSVLMAIPSLMVFLSLALPTRVNRGINIGLGVFYTLIMLMTLPGAWAFYLVLGVIEIILTVLIVGYAWKWPRKESEGQI
jgi:hypothetical protein